jgi:hypothetical protein
VSVVAVLVLALGLVGCGGSSGSGGGTGTGGGSADRAGTGGDAAPEQPDAAVLVGRWVAVSQDGYDLPEGELVFTYLPDGTGVVVEGGSQRKDFTWVYDPDAGTLHVLTVNEDLNFQATLDGDTLSLVNEEPAMALVMRRADDDGGDE